MPEPTATVIVEDPPAVTDAGLKLTVVPDGAPLALRLTVWAEPLVTAVLIVDVPFAPWTMLRLVGFAAIEKSGGGGAVIVRLRVAEWVAVDPVPVTVIVYVPVGAVAVPVLVYFPGGVRAPPCSLMVAEPPELAGAGLKLTVVPAGSPLALRFTVCAPPLVIAVLTVEVPLAPWPTVRPAGFALIEKSEGPLVQLGNLKDAIRVCQLKLPFAAGYRSVYQN